MGVRRCVGLAIVAICATAHGAWANLPKETVDTFVVPAIETFQVKGLVVGLIDETGQRNLFGYGDTPDARTIFEIGSVTKVFTSLLLADMAEAGEVKLDQPLSELLPAGVKVPAGQDGKPITLAHLATHTSGLPRMPANFFPVDPANPYADYTTPLLYEALATTTLNHDPGDEYDYSNFAVGLLGHVLALKSGKSYEALMVERILGPLKMSDTRITLDEAARKRLVRGHHAIGDEVPTWGWDVLAGCGALRSTADDMLTFLAANMEMIDVPASLRAAMRATHEPRGKADARTDIALGWHVGRRTGTLHHTGATGGYYSFVGLVPDQRVGVVVLSNTGTGVINTLGTQLIQASLGEPVEPLPRPTTVPIP